jgi:hypothetical protein
VDGVAAPPRRNGELVFEAPWQSRGLCAAIVETCFDRDREPFHQQLIAAIAAEPDRPYWDKNSVAGATATRSMASTSPPTRW